MNTAEHRTLMKVRGHLYDALVAAQKERVKRGELVDTPTGPEFGWVLHERAVMLAAVNRQRVGGAALPVDEALIVRAEQQAVGHVDYTAKYALYCAEIALGVGHGTQGATR